MAYFVVSYELRKARDYQPLWDEFERLGAFKPLNSVYLIERDNTSAAELRDHLEGFIDDDDGLVVIEVDQKPAAFKCKVGTAK